jgi:hypothetical protein
MAANTRLDQTRQVPAACGIVVQYSDDVPRNSCEEKYVLSCTGYAFEDLRGGSRLTFDVIDDTSPPFEPQGYWAGLEVYLYPATGQGGESGVRWSSRDIVVLRLAGLPGSARGVELHIVDSEDNDTGRTIWMDPVTGWWGTDPFMVAVLCYHEMYYEENMEADRTAPESGAGPSSGSRAGAQPEGGDG